MTFLLRSFSIGGRESAQGLKARETVGRPRGRLEGAVGGSVLLGLFAFMRAQLRLPFLLLCALEGGPLARTIWFREVSCRFSSACGLGMVRTETHVSDSDLSRCVFLSDSVCFFYFFIFFYFFSLFPRPFCASTNFMRRPVMRWLSV